MKNNLTKKIISLVLALIMTFSTVGLCVYATADEKNDYPIIYVHGFMASNIYADKNDASSELYFPIQSEHIIDGVKLAVPALAEFIIKRDWDGFGKAISPVLENIFYGLYNNPDGTTKGKSGNYFKYPTKQEMESSSEIAFEYDWRCDPVDIASELNDFVAYVKQTTEKSKVYLRCHSLGGVIVTSYLSIYGGDNVAGVAFDATAVYGESYTGDLLTGNIEFSSEALLFAIENILKGNDEEYLIDSFLEVFEEAGIFKLVSNLGNDLAQKLKAYLYESLAALFANWLTIWAMIPDEQVDDAIDFVFTEIYDKNDKDAKNLLNRIENYNRLVRENKTQTLKSLDENAKVVVISRYGYSSLPITPSWNSLSDGTVDTKYNSFGATTSSFGETLSEEYLKGKDMKYISPDKTVDASTCLFPDKTWFIRNIQHAKGSSDLNTMIHTLLKSENEATVDTYKQYPRFMQYIASDGSIFPDVESVEIPSLPQNFMGRIIKLFKALFNWLKRKAAF